MVEVTVSDVPALVESGAMLLDVREADEWEAGHAPGASFMPMSSVQLRVAELPSDRTIIVVCRSGGRSGVVTEGLLGMGLQAVNLAGGMQAWAGEQGVVITDTGAPGTVI